MAVTENQNEEKAHYIRFSVRNAMRPVCKRSTERAGQQGGQVDQSMILHVMYFSGASACVPV